MTERILPSEEEIQMHMKINKMLDTRENRGKAAKKLIADMNGDNLSNKQKADLEQAKEDQDKPVYIPKSYMVDCQKIHTIQDIKDVLACLGFGITWNTNDPAQNKMYEPIKHLLVEISNEAAYGENPEPTQDDIIRAADEAGIQTE